MAMDGIQSLERGLEALKLLAENGRMTASAAAERLGIHQSSASRLLLSLQRAGLVRKPDFHSFAPDFGLLSFAGAAMASFPELAVCAGVCGRLSSELGCGAASATLFQGRLIYFAWVAPGEKPLMKLVDNSSFPVYRSSLGILLAYRLGRLDMIELLSGKMREDGVPAPEKEAAALFRAVENGLAKDGGIFAPPQLGENAFNYSMDFEGPSGRIAYALFSPEKGLSKAKAKNVLSKAVEESLKKLPPNAK